MGRLSERNIILVTRKTRLEELIARYNTLDQAQFYIEHLGADFSDYRTEHDRYQQAVTEAYHSLEAAGRVQAVDREFVPNFVFGPEDIIVVAGQDGLVVNTLKYLSNQVLIGVNPDPARWDGLLLPFTVADLRAVIQDVVARRRPVKEVSMAKATLTDGQSLYAVNDLFIGQRTHVSSRYEIALGQRQERQSSSGVIVSTGLGSTGWLSSVLAGATKITSLLAGGSVVSRREERLDWNAEYLYFSVREPFPSKNTKTDLVFGKVTPGCPLKILSQMPENGVIFSDGVESDYIQFNSGMEACITLAEKKGYLVL